MLSARIPRSAFFPSCARRRGARLRGSAQPTRAADMRVFGAIDRWLARCWLAYPQLARRLLDACALYLRHAPCATGQRSLLTFCMRSLLPALPLFADAVVSLSARPGVRMRCFQLGGAHQADILSEWLLLTGAWQPALTAYMLRSLLPGDTLVDVGANTGYFALLGR